MFQLNTHSLEQALHGVKKMIADNEKNSQRDFQFQSFTVQNHPHTLAAIDGSNHNIQGTNLTLAALRTGYLLYEKGQLTESAIDPISLEFIMNNEDPEVGYLYKHEFYYHSITGELPSGKLEFDKVVERIRTLLEWQKVDQLIDRLQKNDIIIFDGSFMSGEISTSHEFFSRLVAKAKTKGISLVGLSKDTSLSIDSASITSVLRESSKRHHPNQNWVASHDDVHFVQFSKMRDLVFRIDAVIPDHLSLVDIVSWVGSYAFDTMLFGYPFPMQKIHDAVRISEAERDFAFSMFKRTCLQNGVSPDAFQRMFSIYHDQLDIKSFGR